MNGYKKKLVFRKNLTCEKNDFLAIYVTPNSKVSIKMFSIIGAAVWPAKADI